MNRTIVALMLSAGMLSSVVCAEDTNKTEAAPKPSGTPKIVFDKTVYDFGTTSMVTSVTGTFTFHNAGDAVLEVKKPTTSCGCTVAGVKPETLKPDEKGELVFTLSIANGFRGTIQKSITVPSNDPQSPNVGLSIKVDVVLVFDVSPQQVLLGNLRPGTTTNVAVHVKRNDGKKLQFTKIDSTSDFIRPQLVPVASTNGSEAEIRIEAATETTGMSRSFNSQVRAYTDDPNVPAVTIPVYGQVLADLSVMPAAVVWPIADPDRWPGARPELMNTRVIRVISNNSDTPLEIKNLTTSLPNLTVTLMTLQTGKVYQVVARLPEVPKDSERGTISFDTNIPSQPTVVVPVTIAVPKR
jgi:hypothetical protein